jgi:hypothetical protein
MDFKLTPKPQRQPRTQNNNNNMNNLRQIMAQAMANQNAPSNKTLRNRRRRQRQRSRRNGAMSMPNQVAMSQDVAPYHGVIQQFIPPSVSLGNSRRIREMNTSLRRVTSMKKLTPDGLAFLKCAFAPPDFAVSNVKGAPDKFEHESYVAKHRLTSSFTNPGGRDTYFWLCPSPGIAFAFINKAAGSPVVETDVWQPVPYEDFQELFGLDSRNTADKITQYRFVSNHMELVPTVNQMQWSGSISAFKFQSTVNVRQQGTANNILGMTGLEAVNSTNANMYSGPVINGVYTGAYNSAAEFEWQNVYEGVRQLPETILTSLDFTQLNGVTPPGGIAHLAGLDNGFESVVIKVTNSGSDNTFILRNYACVQYKVRPGQGASVMYNAQTVACHDELALTLYKRIVAELPVGVTYTDNDSFWQRVLQIIQMVSGGLSVLPGPYGAAAGGVNMLSGAIEKLAF